LHNINYIFASAGGVFSFCFNSINGVTE